MATDPTSVDLDALEEELRAALDDYRLTLREAREARTPPGEGSEERIARAGRLRALLGEVQRVKSFKPLGPSLIGLEGAAKELLGRNDPDEPSPRDSFVAEVYGSAVGGLTAGATVGAMFGGEGIVVGAAIGAVTGAISGGVKYIIKKMW